MRVRRLSVLMGAVSVLAAGMLMSTVGSATAQPRADGAREHAGELVRAEQTTVYAAPLLADPVRAWSLLYRSTSATGATNEVSGTLLVPPAAWAGPGARPVVSYAVGTHGLGDQCAPSSHFANGREQEFGLMRMALDKGWAVVVTDYEGLGTPGDHSYAVARSEGHAVLDAVRAAIRVDGAGIAPDAPVGLWGYSQGGGAVAAAAQQAATYAPELDVRGAAPGGVPADLLAVAENLDGGPAAGLLVAATGGLDTAYPELGLFEQLNARGQALVAQVRQQCVEQIVLTGFGARIEDLSTVPDPLHQPAVLARLTENGAGSVAPKFPVRVYHAQLDELIPLAVGKKLAADWCGLGVEVEFEELPLQSHTGGAVAGAERSVSYLADRFAGRPAPSTC